MTKTVSKPTTRRTSLPPHKPGYATLDGNGSRICGAIATGGNTYYAHDAFSHNGSVIKQTNAAGDVIRHTEYNAFGQVLGQSTSGPDIPNRFGYHTNWLTMSDSDGDVLASPTRTYLAHLGMFAQRDPLFYDLEVGQPIRGRSAITANQTAGAFAERNRLWRPGPGSVDKPLWYFDGASLHQGLFAQAMGTDAMGTMWGDRVYSAEKTDPIVAKRYGRSIRKNKHGACYWMGRGGVPREVDCPTPEEEFVKKDPKNRECAQSNWWNADRRIFPQWHSCGLLFKCGWKYCHHIYKCKEYGWFFLPHHSGSKTVRRTYRWEEVDTNCSACDYFVDPDDGPISVD